MLPLLWLPRLPTLSLWLLGGLLLVVLCWRGSRYGCQLSQLLAALLFGFIFATGSAQWLMHQIASLVEGGDKQVIASVESVRFVAQQQTLVKFRIEQVDQRWLMPAFSFSAVAPVVEVCAGQRWRMKVNFRRLHSSLNEGGFDSERWAMANRQPLRGSIRSAELLDTSCDLRQQFIRHIDAQIEKLAQRPLLLALAFGERGLIDKSLREQLVKTGIAHLVAISGLHIALAAAFAWWLARAVQFFLPAHYIGYRMPLLMGWCVALCYVWLAGEQLPAMRAMISLSLWLLLRLKGLCCSAWQIWLWCVCLLLLFEPMSLLSDSFWLSVLAVAALIFWFEWAPLPRRLRASWIWAPLGWLHMQLGMTLLLLPLQFTLFHGVSWSSLLANLWAVPIVSLLTVPLILSSLLLSFVPWLSGFGWQLADVSISLALWPLDWLQQGWLPLGRVAWLWSLVGWLLVLCLRLRWWYSHPIGCFTLLLCCWFWREPPVEYRWRVDMLDVGHGLAVLIERDGKGVIYDTGDRWQNGSAAERFILPFLHWRQISLQHIFISHSHQDHIGGLQLLSRAFPLAQIHSPLSNSGHQPCIQGQHWVWQGLDFDILWPPKLVAEAGNAHSCVLRINDGNFSLLLTGDIEAETERALLKQRKLLPTTVLQVPHHGSRTSSSAPFLRAVAPKAAVASVARYNRWRLPADRVVSLYRQNKITWYDTSLMGQLSLFFFASHWEIKRLRSEITVRWWHI
ncbi:DNA internalization-related competence protein ComEC/Rec2 [Serratia microhaemolytica]|uniref:DNA internalization-related competence protein ComEC/Rec2 n=1 Tax=Serratia microhaemolytica TaxID=2675110 RepID=UPI000FDD1210|nr:DNA internalization-related competence protein ComEC/Rec2 [Serratia microhaemolytica]